MFTQRNDPISIGALADLYAQDWMPEDPDLAAHSLQQAPCLLDEKAAVGAFPERSIEQQKARRMHRTFDREMLVPRNREHVLAKVRGTVRGIWGLSTPALMSKRFNET